MFGSVSYRHVVCNVSCREQLKRNYNLARFRLDVGLQDVSAFDEDLGERLNRQPAEYLPLVIKYLVLNFIIENVFLIDIKYFIFRIYFLVNLLIYI